MVGSLRNARKSDPTARIRGQAPAHRILVGMSLMLAIVAASATATWAENPATPVHSTAAPSADSLATLKSQIEKLSIRLKALQEQVKTQPQPRPAPDLDTLRAKLDELARSATALTTLANLVDGLEERIASADKQVAGLQEQVVAVREQRKQAEAEAKAAAAAAATPPRPTTATDEELKPGIAAFKASRYKEANALFQALTGSHPDDARAWYYAALSNGLATSQWKDETIRLFNKAVERERAGTPDKAKIDASLASVTEPSVKRWVDYFRKAAQR